MSLRSSMIAWLERIRQAVAREQPSSDTEREQPRSSPERGEAAP